MNKLTKSLFTLFVLFAAAQASAYDFLNHFDMSNAAVARSLLATDPTVIQRLGLESLTQEFKSSAGLDSKNFILCGHGEKFSASRLIACGAQFEDFPLARVLNHFYDPINNGPLTVRFLGVWWVKPGNVILEPNLTSPDWALKDNNDEEGQGFSYKDARASMFLALTGSTAAIREDAWGRTFQSLGQVIHHLQDMAQPQHVRNDQHVSIPVPFYFNPSLFEKSTDENGSNLIALMSGPGSDPVYIPGTSSAFSTPRDFWKNASGTGIAEVVNRNFVSAGTNFELRSGRQVATTRYPLPQPGQATPVSVQDLDVSQDIKSYCFSPPACMMTFYSTNDGTPEYNERASALSVFDQYVQLRPAQFEDPVAGTYQTDRSFTVNRFTFASAYPLLLPRAVGYSAGMINYFFRGKMKISRPNEGVYGVVDHASAAGNDPATGGFGTIKLKIQNLTSIGKDTNGKDIIEPMTEGPAPTFVAVAKFHRNTCYTSTLSGEYGAPGWGSPDFNLSKCRSSSEEIVVSDSAPVPAGINDAPQQVEFTFTNKIPISATDLYLQVVYRGKLGDELDAVVVETKDISEPSYAYNFVTWDQFTYWGYPSVDPGNVTFDQWCAQGYPTRPACDQAMGTTLKFKFSPDGTPIGGYDPATAALAQGTWADVSGEPPFTPLTRLATPVAKFQRVAVLMDVNPSNLELVVEEMIDDYHARGQFQWFTGIPQPAINQLDPATNTLTPAVTYIQGRGVYLPAAEGPRVNGRSSNLPPSAEPPPFTLTPSQVTF